METQKWQLVARDGDGLDVTLIRKPSLEEIDTEYARLAPSFPGYGPWQARRGNEIVDLPRAKDQAARA